MTDYTWQGPDDLWSQDDDWTSSDVDDESIPGPSDTATFGDDATIADSGTAADIYVDASLTVLGSVNAVDNFLVNGSLSVESGGAIGAGNLTVVGSADFDDATAMATSFVSVDDGGSITFDDSSLTTPSLTLKGSGDFDDTTLQISNFVSVTDTGSLSLDDSSLNADSLTLDGSGEFDDATADVTNFVTVDDNGSLTLEGGSTLDTDDMVVHGTLDIDDGTITTTNIFQVDDGMVTIGQSGELVASSQVDSTSPLSVKDGSIDVDGSGASLESDGPGGVVIGYSGDGSLTIEDGGAANFMSDTNFATLGIGYMGGDGTVTVEGSGSSLTVSGGNVQVDSDAGSQGELDIEDGATADFSTSNGGAPLVVGQGGDGDVDVDGAGSSLTASGGDNFVGTENGTGDLTVEDGATVTLSSGQTDDALDVGDGGHGSVTVEGNGSSLSATGAVTVGSDSGTGDMTIEDGAVATVVGFSPDNYAMGVGVGQGGDGTLTVTGSGVTLTASVGGLTIGGDSGTGKLDISDGGVVSTSDSDPDNNSAFEIGDDGMGTVDVTGSGSQLLTTSGQADVGIAAGSGKLTIEDSGAASFTTDPSVYALLIGSDNSATGAVTVTGQGATLTTNGGGVSVGDDGTGTLDIASGGSATFTTPGADDSLEIGGTGGNGTVTVDGSGSALNVTGEVVVGYDGVGALTISDGGLFSSSYAGDEPSIDVGLDDSADGTMTVTGSSTTVTLDQAQGIVIGDSGTGLLEVESGANFSVSAFDPSSDYAVELGTDDNASGSILIDGSGSTLTASDGGMVVGRGGAGYVDVTGGGALDVTDPDYGLTIADDDTSVAEVDVSGNNSILSVDGPVLVGNGGTGSLTVDDGATFLSSYSNGPSVDIGVQEDSNGTMTVADSGTDITLDQGDGIVVGDSGMGELEVDDGATLSVSSSDPDTASAVILGSDFTGDGTLTVTGSGSTFTAASGELVVGSFGGGTVTVSDGGVLNADDATYGLTLASEDDATGDVTVKGSDSKIEVKGPLSIGYGGIGAFTVENGATLSVDSPGFVNIGVEKGSDGTLTLQDDDTTFDYDGTLTVGDSGAGTFEIKDAASWESQGDIIAADDDGSTGAIMITGKESSLTVGGALTLGKAGDSTLDVDDGASLTVRGDATEAEDDSATGVTTIDGTDTTVTYDGDDVIGSEGEANDTISGGATAKIDGGGDLTLGEKDTGDGTLTIKGQDSSFDAGAGTTTIGSEGTGEIDVMDGGGELSSSGTIAIGDEDGSNGTLNIDGEDSSVDPADVTVGSQGTGVVMLSAGGSLEANNLTLGEEDGGDGTVTVADADSSLTVDADLEVGAQGQGLLVVDGDSTVSGDATIGSEDGGSGQVTVNIATLEIDGKTTIGKAGTGSMLVQLGATLTAHDVTLGDEAGGDGTLTVSGDDTNATTDGLTVGGSGQGTLEVDDSGSLTSNADSTLGETASANIQTATIESDGSWTIAGGGLTVGDAGIANLTIGSGGSVSASEDVTLGDQGAATGEIDVSGVSSSVGATPSSLTFGGTLTVGGSGKGTLDITRGGQFAPNSGGKGEIDIAAKTGAVGEVTVDGAGSTLQGETLAVGGTADAAGGSGTLDISNGAVATTTDAIVWTGGQVTLAGGDLAGSSIMLSGAISGYGSLSGDIESGSAGSITASDGELSLSGNVDTSATSFEIDDISAGSALGFSGAVGGAGVQPTITFGAGSNFGTLDLAGDGSGAGFGFAGVVSGFAGKGVSQSDVIDVSGSGQSGDKAVWTQTNPGVSGTLQIEAAGGGVLESLTLDGAYVNGQFAVNEAANNVDQVTYAACYVRGTRIATARGEAAIEALRIGDLAVTASGALRPIVWIGHRRLDISRHPDPEAVRPVRVEAGAFGEGLPRRDLWLSPGHNVSFDDALMPISSLVNGASVAQINQNSVEYWHVELDQHDVILAEGLPAESYLDTGNRTAFANGGAFIEAHPDFRPKRAVDTCLPLFNCGPLVERARARLFAGLAARGYLATQNADAHVLVDGARVDPIMRSPMRLAFVLPEGARRIALRSDVFVPAHTVPDSVDPRALGLCINRLQIDGQIIELDDDRICASGWHEAERVEGRFLHRWTKGDAPLPAGTRVAIVDLGSVGHYRRAPMQDVRSVL